MLTFYYNPISINARRVWVALLEKQISFESVIVNLDGDQFTPEFTAVNPLQRIPVIVDHGFRVMESLAILDYLEAKYPTPPLMPKRAEAIATVRMVVMIAVNELQPATLPLTRFLVGLEVEAQAMDAARQRVTTVLELYEHLLGEKPYFVGDEITMADVVAGTLVPSLPLLGFSLDPYPHLKEWADNLTLRSSWQSTMPHPEALQAALPAVRKILERRSEKS